MNYSSYEIRSKKYIYFLTLNANLGAIVTGMFFVIFNACIWEVLASLGPSGISVTFNKAILSGSIPFGAIIGASISSIYAATKGRRKTMILCDLITIPGCILSVIPIFGVMVAGRIICGIVAGINSMVIPLYAREVSPPELSGRIGSFFRIMFTVGLALTFLMSFGLQLPPTATDFWWRVICLVPSIFAIARSLVFFIWVKLETPRFYMSQLDDENAHLALQKIYKEDQVDHVYQRETRFEKSVRFTEVFTSRYQRQAIVILLLIFVNEFMGSNALNFYSTDIFFNNKIQGVSQFSEVRLFNLCFSVVILLATVLGQGLIDRIGRRPLVLYGTIACSIASVLVAVTGLINFSKGQEVLVIIFIGLQNLSISLVLPIYSAELLPSYGVGLQVNFQMICILAVTFCFPFISVEIGFFIFALVGVLSFIPLFKLVKETKGKTLNEIYKTFHAEKTSGLLDEEVSSDQQSPTI